MSGNPIPPSELERQLKLRLAQTRANMVRAYVRKQRHGLHLFFARFRKPMTLVTAAAGILVVSALVAAANDSGDFSVEVSDNTQCATGTTSAGAIVDYIGNSCTSLGSAGTGVFQSFVRIQGSPTESGYNTDGTLEFDSKSGTWTHSMLLSNIPVITVGGHNYWELFADINETNSTSRISLNKLEVYFTDNHNLTGYPFTGHATQEYAFSGNILINDVNAGSGEADLRYRIPVDSIAIPPDCGYLDAACSTYFVLYSEWGTSGVTYNSDGGFEEWKVKQYPTLQIVKNTLGGDGTFGYTVGGPTPLTPDVTTSSGTGSTQNFIVDPGTYTITESTSPSGWTFVGATCSLNGGTATTYTQGSTLTIGATDHLVCTFTNGLLPKLKVVKVLDPTNDSGLFNLQIDGTTAGGATDVGNNGTTGFQTVSVGDHSVGETAGTGTSLSNYDSSISCDNTDSGTGTSLSGISLTYGDAVTCTITNHRIPTITVDKVLVPSSDPGLFNLQIDGSTAGTGANVGDGGTTGAVQTTTGSHTVGETAGTSTTLTDYSSSTSCANNGGTASAYTGSITVAYGDNWVCTITNSRLPKIIVQKITTGSFGGPFTFTTTGDHGFTTPFSLTTTATGLAGLAQQSFTIDGGGIGGNFTVTEGITAGFVLTDVSCTVTTAGVAGTTTGSDVLTRTGTITNLTAGTTVTCTFTNSGALTTRTQGFWATHSWLVALVWSPTGTTVGGITTDGMTDAERTLCTSPLTVDQVMGGFWANIAK
ncbi:MAG TPA: hypothetical protein VKQ71_05540, partial [Acidimicrobiales bacterium]|nr:hypothetical protein [Acidimicrobiales bacterium]